MTRHRELVIVTAVTGLGAVLRLYQIGTQSLWLDELFSVAVARGDWAQVIAGTAQGDTNPPLFNLLLHLSLQFGTDEVAARAISCLFSIMAIPLFYVVARQLCGVHVALLASLALAINPFHVYFAQEARMYAQLAFFSLAAMFFFLRAWRGGGVLDWVFFALTMTLAFYTHSLAFLNLLALDIFALTQRRTSPGRWRGLVSAHVVIVIAFVPWLFVLVQQVARVQSGFWGAVPSPLSLFATLYLFIFSNTLPTILVPFALFAILTLIAFGFIAAARTVVRQLTDAAAVQFSLVIFIVPLFALFVLSLIRPIYVERTLLPASFGLYLLLAWALARAQPRALMVTLGALVLLGTTVALPEYYFNPENQKPPMREAARTLAAQFHQGDVVVHTSDSSALAFMYYDPALPNHFLAGDPDYMTETTRGRSGRIAGLVPENIAAIVAGHSRVWLVVALDHNEEYQQSQVAWFKEHYMLRQTLDVNGIVLLCFDFPLKASSIGQ